MSDDYQKIEVITGTARRRRWSTEETLNSAESISPIARRLASLPIFFVVGAG